MKNANVSWFVKEPDDVYVAHTEYYAGSCISGEDFIVDVELWNNRWNNTEDVADMINAKLAISFSNAEDSVLLSLCEVKVNDGAYNKPNTSEFNRALVDLGTIAGTKNNGHSSNTDNYKKISIKFSNIPTNFKSSLKSMFLDVQYDE